MPLNLPLYIQGTEPEKQESVFSIYALSFLEMYGIKPVGGYLDGKEVWMLYEQLIRNKYSKKEGFDIRNMINFKTLQNILSKFSFSLISHSKDYQGLLDCFGVEQYGYLYFSHWNEEKEGGKPYDYETGLNNQVFKDAHFI